MKKTFFIIILSFFAYLIRFVWKNLIVKTQISKLHQTDEFSLWYKIICYKFQD